ncbi:hypothetical protein MMC07_006687 [Pseudocyphellaria aurata]|nr:hypothetical protein [Pseudocyphellaria aurata]
MPAQIIEANKPNVKKTLQTIVQIDRSSFTDDGKRSEALLAAYALVSRLETPWETVARLGMAQPALGGCLKVARDLKIFESWHDQDDEPRTSKQLAELVSCDAVLMGKAPIAERILRHLASHNVLDEVSPETYKQTALTLALIQPVFGAWISYLYDVQIPCFHKMPEYLAKTGYTNPADPADGIFQYTKGWKGTLFDFYDSHPEESQTFNDVMGGVMAQQASWLDIYPHEELLKVGPQDNPSAESSAILVDVGGNVGRDLDRFRVAHPELAGRLVLQDRPEVIANAINPKSVQRMGYDFFQPQPIKGARAYYLHGILHDWSDVPARQILHQLRSAMTAGYSKLLIHDHVLPKDHPNPQATAYDLTMMINVSAMERNESAWHDLLGSVGLKVVKIWKSPLATQSVIEAELA